MNNLDLNAPRFRTDVKYTSTQEFIDYLKDKMPSLKAMSNKQIRTIVKNTKI